MSIIAISCRISRSNLFWNKISMVLYGGDNYRFYNKVMSIYGRMISLILTIIELESNQSLIEDPGLRCK